MRWIVFRLHLECIHAWIVHARASGVNGHFELTHSLAQYTTAIRLTKAALKWVLLMFI
ncbi:MAG: catalase [Proteobacteria bacterium]|nr:catalase [Pseudomonadota bacterium]